jgi:hypothetical protein
MELGNRAPATRPAAPLVSTEQVTADQIGICCQSPPVVLPPIWCQLGQTCFHDPPVFVAQPGPTRQKLSKPL